MTSGREPVLDIVNCATVSDLSGVTNCREVTAYNLKVNESLFGEVKLSYSLCEVDELLGVLTGVS